MNGIDALLTLLSGHGVRSIFGNPGSTELPLIDALSGDERFDYYLALQEVPAVAMADGFAMASGTLGVVNLHIAPGLGNGMGMLYNAFCEGTPLLVTAGQQDRRLRLEDPVLAGDLVSVARPWTKSAFEVTRVQDVPGALRRAVMAACTPPTGPVFLSLPVDIQQESHHDLDLTPIGVADIQTRPPERAIGDAAQLLSDANRPGILAGSRVTERGGIDELVVLAEQLGAPVMYDSHASHGRLPFPCDHPLSGFTLPLWSPDVRRHLDQFDVLLVVGMDLLNQYIYHEPSRPIPEHIQLIHLDEDPREIGKNYGVEVGLIGGIKSGLAELSAAVGCRQTSKTLDEAARRLKQHAEAHRDARGALRRQVAQAREARPMRPITLMDAVGRSLPPNVAVVEEAATTCNNYLERLGALKDPTGYFGHRGWGLGWGLGCALGVQVAWPERPVLALLGDGASLYGIQGLWTAARYKIPVVFVICNNAQYRILKQGAEKLNLKGDAQGQLLGTDLVDPEIDYVQLAQSLGVDACRVEEPDALSDMVTAGLKSDQPLLIDVPIARDQ